MPVRLEIKEENRVCWFRDDYDLQKHLNRSKLDKRKIKIIYRDGEPVQSNVKQTREVWSQSTRIKIITEVQVQY
jgi:hypothetical protein